MGAKALELVVYTLNQEVSREQFLATNPAVEEWIRSQPGFVSRECVHDDEHDRWVDIVWWETLDAAREAAQLAATSAACAPMFALIDLDSMLVLHGVQARSVLAAPPAVEA